MVATMRGEHSVISIQCSRRPLLLLVGRHLAFMHLLIVDRQRRPISSRVRADRQRQGMPLLLLADVARGGLSKRRHRPCASYSLISISQIACVMVVS